MPIMGGEDATKLILEYMKNNTDLDLSHIIAVTSFTNKKTIDTCISIGMKSVYAKPLKMF